MQVVVQPGHCGTYSYSSAAGWTRCCPDSGPRTSEAIRCVATATRTGISSNQVLATQILMHLAENIIINNDIMNTVVIDQFCVVYEQFVDAVTGGNIIITLSVNIMFISILISTSFIVLVAGQKHRTKNYPWLKDPLRLLQLSLHFS